MLWQDKPQQCCSRWPWIESRNDSVWQRQLLMHWVVECRKFTCSSFPASFSWIFSSFFFNHLWWFGQGIVVAMHVFCVKGKQMVLEAWTFKHLEKLWSKHLVCNTQLFRTDGCGLGSAMLHVGNKNYISLITFDPRHDKQCNSKCCRNLVIGLTYWHASDATVLPLWQWSQNDTVCWGSFLEHLLEHNIEVRICNSTGSDLKKKSNQKGMQQCECQQFFICV